MEEVLVRFFQYILLFLLLPTTGVAGDSPQRIGHSTGDERFSQQLTAPDEAFAENAPLRRFKKQAIQKVAISGGGLLAVESGDLSTSFLQASVGFGIPLGDFDNILGVSPSFRVDWIDSQVPIDVPSTLYATGVQFFWRKPISDRWSFMAIAGPSIRSDFSTSDEAFRIFGLALLTWQYIPNELSLSFGAVYLDRADIPLLPAVGLSWTPSPSLRLDLRFPESRLSYRIAKNGAESEVWAYLAGGLGGNTWAVTRQSGRSDELSLRDFRLKVGLQRIIDGGGGCFVELGYAFARRLEYERTDTEISLSDAIVLQAGWNY